jgi:hypothetical protein
MIVSPRAKPVIDILRIEGNLLVEIDEVYLYRRAKDGSAYEKILYWKRDEDNSIVDGGSCCCNNESNSCDCDHTSCVIVVEADYDMANLTFDRTVRVLDGDGNLTGDTIHLDHIIEMEAN